MREPRTRLSAHDRSRRLEFVVVFFIAAVGSFAVAGWTAAAWAPGAWGAAWMGIYLAGVRVRSPNYFETEDFADSFYYLGFLLTLAALAGVLVRLGDLGEDLLATVLAQFGLALVTTIVGLAGRTILLMSRSTLADAEERAGERVARAFDDYTRSLNRLSAEADSFAAGFGERLRTSLARVEGGVEQFATAATATRDRLSAVHDGLDSLGGALSGTASDVQASGQRLAGDLRDVGASAQPHLAEIVRQLDQTLGRLKEVTAALEELGGGMDTATRETTERLRETLSHVTISLDTLGAATRAAAAGLEDESGGMAGVVLQWRGQAEELARVHSALVAEAQGSGKAVAEVRREIAAGVEALIAELRPSAPAVTTSPATNAAPAQPSAPAQPAAPTSPAVPDRPPPPLKR